PEARSKMIKLTRRGAGWDRRSGRSFVSGVEQSGRRVHEDLRHSACLVGLRLELNDAIVKVCDREIRFVAQPEAQRQTRCRAKRVAPVEAEIVQPLELDFPIALDKARELPREVVRLIIAAPFAIEAERAF